jgi:hypothetical protein
MMGSGSPADRDLEETSLVDALLVYAEPLAEGAHVVVIGDAESAVTRRLFELGVRSIQVFDPDPARAANAAADAPPGVSIRPLVDELDVRDGAYDLALVPDMADLNDPHALVGRLRRAVAPSGAIVAMGRAVVEDQGDDQPFGSELGLATLDYSAFYELFATEFDEVTLAGVVPFRGVVFAELGGEEDDSPPVSVDTRLAPPGAPSVFVVVGSQRTDRSSRPPLDPYAIVQVSEAGVEPRPAADPTFEADYTAMQLKAELLAAQLEEVRERLDLAELRGGEVIQRLERASLERDAALTRGMELETVLAAAQQTLIQLERRLVESEQDQEVGIRSTQPLDQTPPLGAPTVDVQSIVSRAEQAEAALALAMTDLAAMQEVSERTVSLKNIDVGQLRSRAEQAETALANYAEDMGRVSEAQAHETASFEERLRERAHVLADLERELARRGQMIQELVAALEETRAGRENGVTFEAVPVSVAPSPRNEARNENSNETEVPRLRSKLDALALEVARREGELTARAWRITELENENRRLSENGHHAGGSEGLAQELGQELRKAREELDALRQALTQEHAARVAAESGEELTRARAQLAHQAALLEQVRGRAPIDG